MSIPRILTLAALLAFAPSLFAQSKKVAAELRNAPAWPEVWGNLGLRGIAAGERVAPNGVEFDPIFASDFNLNLGLLPRKKLYLFLETEFWAQRAAPGITNANQGDFDFSKREFDAGAGLAWNVIDRLELRVSANALSNLNRGTSRTEPDGDLNGVRLEGRYYFGSANIYDVGRLSFIGLGYSPRQTLIGGNGFEFDAGLFAQAYATCSIPALRSYLFGHARLIGEEHVKLRLLTVDAGIATRPFGSLPNVEFRVGNEFTADLQEDITHNLIYGAIRAYYGPGLSSESGERAAELRDVTSSPEFWGDFALSVYAAGDRVAPNGVAFNPIFMSKFNLNLGLLSRKRIYLFLENEFWIQRSTAAGRPDDPETNDVSEREFNINAGLAWNVFSRFELRASAYGLNNLNRGGSATTDPSKVTPSGYQDGVQLEARYYFHSANIYDLGRVSFIAIGYYPSQTLVGGDGVGFHPGVFARAYATYGIPRLRSFLYGDARFIAQEQVSPRLITFDAGLAARPFQRFENLELRLGNELTADVKANTARDLVYGAIRLNFSTR